MKNIRTVIRDLCVVKCLAKVGTELVSLEATCEKEFLELCEKYGYTPIAYKVAKDYLKGDVDNESID